MMVFGNRILRRSVTIGVAALISGLYAVAPAAAQYYKGKTLTILVGFPAGGGSDVQARIYQRHLAKHIPGNPKIIVKNLPGAGSLKAQNFMAAKAPKDGSIFMFSNFQPMGQLLGSPGVRFKYGDFTWLAGGAGAELIMFARNDSIPGGLKTGTDIMKGKGLKFAAVRPTATLDVYGRITLEVLGLDHIYVPGYRGAAKFRAAVRRNEAQLAAIGTVGWRSGVEPNMGRDGTVRGLWYWPFSDGKGGWLKTVNVPEFPSFIEFYTSVHGKPPSGPKWDALKFVLSLYGTMSDMYIGPPGMNKEASAALSKAIFAMLADPEVVAEQKKIIGYSIRPIPVATAERVANSIGSTDPDMVAFWKNQIREGNRLMPKRGKAKAKKK
jgi:tripartite-type tricarboxylate transporter receptor subunit TctC